MVKNEDDLVLKSEQNQKKYFSQVCNRIFKHIKPD